MKKIIKNLLKISLLLAILGFNNSEAMLNKAKKLKRQIVAIAKLLPVYQATKLANLSDKKSGSIIANFSDMFREYSKDKNGNLLDDDNPTSPIVFKKTQRGLERVMQRTKIKVWFKYDNQAEDPIECPLHDSYKSHKELIKNSRNNALDFAKTHKEELFYGYPDYPTKIEITKAEILEQNSSDSYYLKNFVSRKWDSILGIYQASQKSIVAIALIDLALITLASVTGYKFINKKYLNFVIEQIKNGKLDAEINKDEKLKDLKEQLIKAETDEDKEKLVIEIANIFCSKKNVFGKLVSLIRKK